MSVLVLIDHKNGKISKAGFGSLAFAKQAADKLGTPYSLLVAGSGVAGVAEQLTGYGAAAVYVADKPELGNIVAEYYSEALYAAVKASGATFVIGVANSVGKAVLPRVASKMGAGMASDIVAFHADEMTFDRAIFAGNIIMTVSVTTPAKVVSVRGTAFEPMAPVGGSSEVKALDVDLSGVAAKTKFVAIHESASTRPELTEAAIVVSGGRGVKDKDGFEKYIYPLADLLHAAVGATRAVVDAGVVSNDLQVGQTGKIVAPQLYIGLGLSGAIQHLAGMKDSKVIVAVNKDEEAPIFSVADYGIIGDLAKVAPEMVETIKAKKG